MAEEQKGADATGDKKEDAAPEVGQMKRGDYMIHVFIEKARQLKCPEGNTVDPLIEVTCMGTKKFTTAKDDIGATGVCIWNEHLFFEPKNVSQDEIEQGKITLRLLDKGYFKDALIGVYEFDITYIYFMSQHSLMHKWIAMSNPNSETFNEVTGYLKLSITIAASGDEQVPITEDNSTESSEDSIMMPPSIRPEYYQIRFRFFRAEKLPAMDTAIFGGKGSIDAYLICNFMNKKLKTDVKTQKEGSFIDWDQEFLVPCQIPIMASRVVMKLFDEDKLSDEIVGSLLFNLKDCIGAKNGKFFWKNVYGSPLGVSGANTKKMNENPELGSTWKGRILMQIVAEKTEKPLFICQKLPEEVKALALPYMQEKEYELIAEVGQGISLPYADKFSVKICISDHEFRTDKAIFAENTYNRWNYRIKQTSFKSPYLDVYDIGKVFVYLLAGDKPICFYTASIDDFLDPNPQMKWVQLTNDLSLGKVTEAHKAGLISLKISVHDKSKNGPINFEQFAAWKKPPPKRLSVKKVRLYLFQCRDLPAADADGQSDPFIKVWDTSKETKQTRVIEDNLNPMFYECMELSFEANSVAEMPPFLLDVYDMDTLGSDFIARCQININEAVYSEDDTVERPKWHPCRLKPGAPTCGEILCSFSIVEDDFNFKIPLNYVNLKDHVDFQEFMVSINILGLRNLQSAGILPVKKAFIVFNLKSLVPPDEGSAMDNLRTQPSAAGCNPTINTLIKFSVGLPADPLFCPRLSCTVNDYIFKGFSQPMIGSFIIPVGDLIQKLIKEREEETGMIEYILEELDKIHQEQGIISYNVQEESKESLEALSQVTKQTKQVNEKLRMSVKGADKDMKKPLMLNTDFLEETKSPSKVSPGQTTPKRITPSHMSKSQGGGSKSKGIKSVQQFDKFNSGMKNQLLNERKEEQEKIKRELEDQRKRELEDLKRSGGGNQAVKNVLEPSYSLDTRLNVYREVNMPPDSVFWGLGWDENPEQKRRHYRRYYPDELENIKEVMPVPTPFDTYDLKKGQSRGASKGLWPFSSHKEDDSGEVSTEQVVGKFKGIVTVQSEQARLEYAEKKAQLIHDLKVRLNNLSLKKTGKPVELNLEKLDTMEGRQKFELSLEPLGINHLNITQHLANLESDETLRRLLLAQTKCIVRLYMISAYDLASRDNGGFSDPYLKITLGNKTYNTRDEYQLDEPNPEWHQYFDFEATFPGCPPLVIEVVDYDDLFGDDSIGTTIVDLEDRFFSPEWQSIKNKPIEFRQIYHPSSSVSQGVVRCWVEIHPTNLPDDQQPIIYDIKPKPPEEFEVRLVIFDTLDVIAMDSEGTSDVYGRAFFDSREEVHETDTHYRCSNGKASFNYRLLYKVKHPRKDYNLTLQLYDRDFFKSNDIIGDTLIDLRLPFEDCSLSGRPLGLTKTYYNAYMKDKGVQFKYKDENTFYVPIKGRNDKTNKIETTGQVRIQIDIYPKALAEANKVGEARQEPNHSPFLPPPVGRISFTMNPFKMLNQLVGPALRRKIYCYCCIAACCMLCIALAPLIIGNLISALINKALGL